MAVKRLDRLLSELGVATRSELRPTVLLRCGLT